MTKIIMSWLPGSTCSEILQQMSIDYIHPLRSLAMYKCGNIEWFGIPRPFLQPLREFILVESGTLVEDRVKNLFTDLQTFIYWGCGAPLAFPNEIMNICKESLKRVEIHINAPNDEWEVYHNVQVVQVRFHK